MSLPNLPAVREARGEGGKDEEQQRGIFFFNLAGDTEEIQTSIANWLSTEDLRNFRLVSHLSYRACLKLWRKITVPRVEFGNPPPGHFHRTSNLEMLRLNEALDLPIGDDDTLKRGKCPFTEFNVFYWDGEECTGEAQKQLIKQFFIKWSSSLHHLDLQQCKSVGSPSMIRALKYARNLKSLILNNSCLFNYIEDSEQNVEQDEKIKNIYGLSVTHLTIALSDQELRTLRIKYFDILKVLPLLKELTLHLHQPPPSLLHRPEPGFMDLLRKYKEQVGNGRLHVKIHGIVEFDGSLDELLVATLPLEEWDAFVVLPSFEDNLRIKARKLRELTLNHFRAGSRYNVYHPTFPFDIEVPALLKINLIGKVTNSFNFLKFMPALQKVVIWLDYQRDTSNNDPRGEETKRAREGEDFVENTLEIYKSDVQMQRVTYLEIDCYFKMDSLPVMKKLFPNLTVLKMVIQSNEMFRFICRNWQNLTQLAALPGSRIDDSGLAGLVREEETTRYPNLTSLKDLESFLVSSEHVLTDQSVYLSFALMKNLTKLIISSRTNFSNICRKWLDDRFGRWMNIKIKARKAAKRKLPS